MEKFIVLIVLSLCSLVFCRRGAGYGPEYDNLGLDDIIKNDRLVNNLFKCLISGERCTNYGHELKESVEDSITAGCSKCSDKLKADSEKLIHYLIINKPEYWKYLESILDEEHTYLIKNMDKLKEEGYVV